MLEDALAHPVSPAPERMAATAMTRAEGGRIVRHIDVPKEEHAGPREPTSKEAQNEKPRASGAACERTVT